MHAGERVIISALVIYDSDYGNTEKVARAIAEALGVEPLRAEQVAPDKLQDVDLLIVGSPTQGFRPTKPVTNLLDRLSRQALKGKRVAAFDTRIDTGAMDSSILGFIVDKGGYAAKHISRKLERAGGGLVKGPEGFFVEDTEGPLKEGELERAADWARKLLDT
jgi:flavodoxin I